MFGSLGNLVDDPERILFLKRSRKKQFINKLEVTGMVVMLLGVALLFQPFSINVFKWGFPILLMGYCIYNVFSHIPR